MKAPGRGLSCGATHKTWRCGLEAGHKGAHFDAVAPVYWPEDEGRSLPPREGEPLPTRLGPWWRKAPDRCPFCGEDVSFGFRWVRWQNIARCPRLTAPARKLT